MQVYATSPYLSLLLDGISVWVLLHDERVGRLIHFRHAILVVGHVLLEFVKLFLQHFHVLEITTKLLCEMRQFVVGGRWEFFF